MNIIEMFTELLFGILATLGFCLIINIPRYNLIPASIVGGLGWLSYFYILSDGSSKTMAAFIAGCLVSLLSDFCSKQFKEAATVFIIPGILPLVPGAGMYYTMLAIIEADYNKATTTANETFLIAGAIALSLLTMGAILKLINSIIRKVKISNL